MTRLRNEMFRFPVPTMRGGRRVYPKSLSRWRRKQLRAYDEAMDRASWLPRSALGEMLMRRDRDVAG